MKKAEFYGQPLPELKDLKFPGRLFVLEGADGSGRSTQIRLLAEWLEGNGYAIKTMGIKRSNLVSQELNRAKQGNILTASTMSLFYATDFYDQLVNEIVPALKAGLIVLADRYIYTLMARDLVRGANPNWVHNLYAPALKPDAVFYLKISPRKLIERTFQKNAALDYWESGMDLGLSRDMFDSFLLYQRKLQAEFQAMQKPYSFQVVNANRLIENLQRDLRRQVAGMMQSLQT